MLAGARRRPTIFVAVLGLSLLFCISVFFIVSSFGARLSPWAFQTLPDPCLLYEPADLHGKAGRHTDQRFFKANLLNINRIDSVARTLLFTKNLLQSHDMLYWLEGGSLLGAYRDGHIIVWDWDADVTMPYSHYVELRELCAQRTKCTEIGPPGGPDFGEEQPQMVGLRCNCLSTSQFLVEFDIGSFNIPARVTDMSTGYYTDIFWLSAYNVCQPLTQFDYSDSAFSAGAYFVGDSDAFGSSLASGDPYRIEPDSPAPPSPTSTHSQSPTRAPTSRLRSRDSDNAFWMRRQAMEHLGQFSDWQGNELDRAVNSNDGQDSAWQGDGDNRSDEESHYVNPAEHVVSPRQAKEQARTQEDLASCLRWFMPPPFPACFFDHDIFPLKDMFLHGVSHPAPANVEVYLTTAILDLDFSLIPPHNAECWQWLRTNGYPPRLSPRNS